MDLGITNHSVCDKTFFIPGTYKKISSFLKTGSGEKLLSERFRSILVLLENEKSDKSNLILINVWYLSFLQYNLISTHKIGKKKIDTFLQVNEKPSQLIFNDKILDLADLINEQYIIRTYKEKRIQAPITIPHNNISIQHEQLGHFSYDNREKVLSLARKLIFSNPSQGEICGLFMK